MESCCKHVTSVNPFLDFCNFCCEGGVLDEEKGGAMRILVTGGAGYIGSHTCKQLARSGHVPVVYDNFSRGHRWAVRFGPLVEGDLLDRNLLTSTLRDQAIDAVIHFAAVALVGESVQRPGFYYQTNVAGSLSLLQAMHDAGVGKLVFSSTCATYGLPRSSLLDEEHPQVPVNPYGASKLMVERMIQDFCAAHSLSAIALRYFNAAGADPEGELGEVHDPETHLIPNVLRALTGEIGALQLYGQDYDTPDGTCVRDYIHVNDLADAHLRALNHLSHHSGWAAYNLGTGAGNSVLEVIRTVEEVSGRKVPVEQHPRRPGDPSYLVADASRARTHLGWEPHFSLRQSVEHAWAWQQKLPSQLGAQG